MHHHATMPPDKDARAHVPFPERFLSAPAAASCTSTEGDASSAMSGGTAPTAAIVIWFAAAKKHKPHHHVVRYHINDARAHAIHTEVR